MSESSRQVIHPTGGTWKLSHEEEALHAAAKELPNWRLANASRKMLAELTHQLSESMPSLGQPTISDLESNTARRIAGIQLAGLSVRSTGAVMSLIRAGYEPEAGVPLRRLIEAVLRVRAVIDDDSGEHARQWLSGRPQGKIERLAQKYGKSDDLKFLSALAHADTQALLASMIPPGWITTHPDDGYFDVRPRRDPRRSAELLYASAFETTSFAGALAELFGVAVRIPRWLSDELIRIRDQRDALAASA